MDSKRKKYILYFLVSKPSFLKSSLILNKGFAFFLFYIVSRVGHNSFLYLVFKRGVTSNHGFSNNSTVSRKGTL